MFMLGRSGDNDHGSLLLDEFEALLDGHRLRADERVRVVQSRLAALEEEHTDLTTLLRRLEAASGS